jgi:hypothetical protein
MTRLLDVPSDDAAVFAARFHGIRWHDSHPWEIVFGHPHGIMLSPRQDALSWADAGIGQVDARMLAGGWESTGARRLAGSAQGSI